MPNCEEVMAFLTAVEDAQRDPVVAKARHIGDLPEPLQEYLATAIKAVVDTRYERQAPRETVALIPSPRDYPGGLGEAIQALTRVFIDNDAFNLL